MTSQQLLDNKDARGTWPHLIHHVTASRGALGKVYMSTRLFIRTSVQYLGSMSYPSIECL